MTQSRFVLGWFLALATICIAPPATLRAQLTNKKKVVWSTEVAASGGFAGVREAQVLSSPTLTCTASEATACLIDTMTVTLQRNKNYTWRPSLSTGVIFRATHRAPSDSGDHFGIGVGAHFVFVPNGSESRAAPALTIHVGKRHSQVFVGSIFVPVDEVTFPDKARKIVVPKSVDPLSFLKKDAGRGPSFFAGIVISGAAITSGKP